MRALLVIMEVISTATFVAGFILNLLLLYLIRRFSSKELGTYKYLLEVFASYDTYLVFVHHIVNPKTIPSYTGFAFVSDRDFGVFILPCFYSSCYSVPFTILNIHLLYRFWTIREPHKIALFSTRKFVSLLFTTTAFLQSLWFMSCYFLGRPEDSDEIHHYRSLFHEEYEKETNDGCFIMNYWRHGKLNVRPFCMLLIVDSSVILSFSLAATLATLTYQEISKAHHISETIRTFQLRILLAASAQTLTPVIFVYIPYFFNVTISFFGIYSPTYSALGMVLLSFFPCIDAVVIIVLMKPYRDGLLRMLGRRDHNIVMVNVTAFTASTVHPR